MRIAFLTANDPKNKKSWSGIHYYMAKALERHVGEVIYLGPVQEYFFVRGILKLIRILFKLLGLKKYNSSYSSLLSRYYSYIFTHKLSETNVDLVFAPVASTEIAFLKTQIPLVYLSDATFKLLAEYYPGLSGMSKISAFEGNYLEKLAINKADVCIFSSKWALDSAIKDYGANPQTTFFIPFGANIDTHPNKEIINHKLINASKKCTLLFIAKEWERKGGEITIETLNELIAMGLNTELIVCGCQPPQKTNGVNLTIYPFLNKNRPEDYNRFLKILKFSNYLLLPTRADCTPIVFCEANAYGIPVITTNTGGISSIIKNGKNGYVLPADATGRDYANVIYNNFSNREDYYKLVYSTRECYDDLLNWDSWALCFKKIIESTLKSNNQPLPL